MSENLRWQQGDKMVNRGVLAKNYYIDPEAVAALGADIERVMTEADQAMEEASEIIEGIASLTERVPAEIRCSELLDLCGTAQAEIKSFDFLSYGKRVNQGLLNLIDHNQYITENFIRKMRANTERAKRIGEEFRSLTDMITYSGGSLPVKGTAFSAAGNAEIQNTDGTEETAESTPTREELLWQTAARISGVNLGAYGKPIVNSADDAAKATVYYQYLDKYANASILEIAEDLNFAFGELESIDAVELIQIATLNCFEYNWTKSPYVTYQFLNRVIQIADKLGVSPDDLMTVIAVESEFNPQMQNPTGAVGLIQFTNVSIENINDTYNTDYSKEDILAMDALQQLDLVYLHCEGQGNLNDLGDLYMSLFCPAAVGKDDTYVLYRAGTTQYEANESLDTNKDGVITREEVMERVLEKRREYE